MQAPTGDGHATRCIACKRQPDRSGPLIALLKEHIMFEQLAHRLGSLFSSHEKEHEEWLASSADLAELERRQRMLDDNSYPFHVHSSVMPRDWIA
jgi:hypothetical protein